MSLVYKFGGASLRDANSIKKVAKILLDDKSPLIADLLRGCDIDNKIIDIVLFHHNIIRELFGEQQDKMINKFNYVVVDWFSQFNRVRKESDNFRYDQIIAYGELFSSFIVSEYLKYINCDAKLMDIRKFIKTDSSYGNAVVNWAYTKEFIEKAFTFSDTDLYITQGFIASNDEGYTTSLGLEGSDFSASILSYVLDAEKMVVWKDVDGIYSSDPNKFKNVVKLDVLSYQEAVELTYFGAKIIHPKTIKPLENKNIPLFVKSFLDTKAVGTLITNTTSNKLGVEPYVPLFITKDNQTLISISPRDFSFISEISLEQIFSILNSHNVSVNLMQNSAITFSICVDFDSKKILKVIRELRNNYKVRYNAGVSLITIRHYNEKVIKRVIKDKQVFVEQRSRHTARFVVE